MNDSIIYQNQHYALVVSETPVTLQGATYKRSYAIVNLTTEVTELYHPSYTVCLNMMEQWHHEIKDQSHLWRDEPDDADGNLLPEFEEPSALN